MEPLEIGVKDLYCDDGPMDDKPTKDEKPLKSVAKGAKNEKKGTRFSKPAVDMKDPLRTGGGSLK